MTPVPGLPEDPPEGLPDALQEAGLSVSRIGRVWYVSDLAAAQAIIAAHSPVPFVKRAALARLREVAEQRITLFNVIDGGSATNVTAAQFSGYMAALTNRYRTLKAQVQSATKVADIRAIDFGAGWPANP